MPTKEVCYGRGERWLCFFLYGSVGQGNKTTNGRMDYERTAFSPVVFDVGTSRAKRIARRWVRGGAGREGGGGGRGRVFLA